MHSYQVKFYSEAACIHVFFCFFLSFFHFFHLLSPGGLHTIHYV